MRWRGLLTDPELHAEIARTLGDGAKLPFNLAPPMLPGRSPDGLPRKRECSLTLKPALWSSHA
jgi:hypothetical protein